MLLFARDAPHFDAILCPTLAAQARGARVAISQGGLRGLWAVGAIGDTDTLDESFDPSLDRAELALAFAAHGIAPKHAGRFADAVADREGVRIASATSIFRRIKARPLPYMPHARPPTHFEYAALLDVIGPDLGALLPHSSIEIDRAPLAAGPRARNHCEMGSDGIARIRLLATNGTTLAGRTHALVHELGHALIGVARHAGRSYRAPYGSADYAPFLDRSTFDTLCDEEALVRAIADAWLLRRPGVSWARTWPGAVDAVARGLDADELAQFARFRLAQGLRIDVSRSGSDAVG